MQRVKYWMQWLAVLPGGLAAGLLLTFPLHWALRNMLSNWEPYPEWPERVLSPAVIAIGLVWMGSMIAPERRLPTAAVLLSVWMVLLGGGVALTLFDVNLGGRRLFFHGGGLAPLMAFVGGVVGFTLTWNEEKRRPQIKAAEPTTGEPTAGAGPE